MAILGNSKRFIRSPSAQKVIGELGDAHRDDRALIFRITFADGIWSGRIVYHAVNQYAIIADVSLGSPYCPGELH